MGRIRVGEIIGRATVTDFKEVDAHEGEYMDTLTLPPYYIMVVRVLAEGSSQELVEDKNGFLPYYRLRRKLRKLFPYE